VTGLSGLVDDALAPLIDAFSGRLNVTYQLTLPSVSIEGLYILEAFLFNPGTNVDDQITADSILSASVSDVFLTFKASGIAIPTLPPPRPRKLSLTGLEMDLGFKNLAFNAEDFMVGGQPMDLSHLAGLVQTIFEMVWTPESNVAVNEMIRCAINHTVHVSLI
jgi:hypothetical protein